MKSVDRYTDMLHNRQGWLTEMACFAYLHRSYQLARYRYQFLRAPLDDELGKFRNSAFS